MKRGRDKFKQFKPLINILVKCYYILPRKVRVKLFEHYRDTKGLRGILLRYILLKTIAKNVGENVMIAPNVYIFNVENLSIGNNVSIHPMSYIEAKGGIEIGNDVSIAHAVTILSVNHVFDDIKIPIKEQGISFGKVTIESNVWIGAKSSILKGITVKSGSIIGTGAVVTKDIECMNIVGGVPAKTLKVRREDRVDERC